VSIEEDLAEARARNKARLSGALDRSRVLELNSKTRRARDGLSYAEICEAYKAHDGRCAICGCLRGDRNHALDHDHKTMRVRGVLCASCNLGLGKFKDDIDLLRKAIEYLEG
jgi:hypothetical protein